MYKYIKSKGKYLLNWGENDSFLFFVFCFSNLAKFKILADMGSHSWVNLSPWRLRKYSRKSKWSPTKEDQSDAGGLCNERALQFSSVAQSCPTLRPHESQHARPPCPSPTPGGYSNSGPSTWWCHPAISSPKIKSSLSLFQTITVFPDLGNHNPLHTTPVVL